MVVLILTSIFTGFRIASDSNYDSFYTLLDYFLPQGSVFYWHIVSGLILTCVLLAYIFYQFKTGLNKRFSLLQIKSRQNKWLKTSNIICHWLMFLMFIGLLTTGLSLYFSINFISVFTLEKLHRVCVWALIILVFFHILFQWLAGRWKKILGLLFARPKYLMTGSFALLIAILCGILFYSNPLFIKKTLIVHHVQQAPKIDGIPDDDVWQKIQPIAIKTFHGANFIDTAVQVNIRALQHDGIAYFLFEWNDTTRSQKHLPLIKTEQGWKVLQTDLQHASEDNYYEDKFAVMLAAGNPWAASHSIHLGKQPSPHIPASASGRGLHYTTDGSLFDLWHWKSVRTNAVAQADDNFISSPKTGKHQTQAYIERMASGAYPLKNRYLGGLKKDPPMTWSSFDMNWETFSDEYVLPRRLPTDSDHIKYAAQESLHTNVSDTGNWWMEYNDTIPYRAELDDYAIGTIIPGVIIKDPAKGDRGNVSAYGTWKDGRWRLEMKRKLITHSKYDQSITNNTFLWVAVFDHTQTRHSYHLRPVSISLTY